tara:strand:+ start:205 stop:555 length:351 start_codon:yes stop_codon:yes gene_type:complete
MGQLLILEFNTKGHTMLCNPAANKHTYVFGGKLLQKRYEMKALITVREYNQYRVIYKGTYHDVKTRFEQDCKDWQKGKGGHIGDLPNCDNFRLDDYASGGKSDDPKKYVSWVEISC